MNRESRVREIFGVGIGCAVMGLSLVPGCTKPVASSKARVPPTVILDGSEDAPFVCTKIRASGEIPLVDDFEVAKDQILGNDGRDGWWFSYDDATGGKFQREEIEPSGSDKKGRAMHVVSSGFMKWGAGFGANLHPESTQFHGCAYDASAYSGVRVRARGRGRLRMSIADAASTPAAMGGECTRPVDRCYDRPGVWLNLEEQWKSYEFPFCVFLPEGWGGSTEGLDPSKLFAFHFRVGEHEDADLWLDDLSFFGAAMDAPAPRCGLPCPLEAAPHSAKIDPLFLDAPTTKGLSVHTFEQATKSCGAITRRYLSYVPIRLPPRSSAPVLLMLHGSGANAESTRHFMTRNRFDALADRDGFIVVYGNAAPGVHTSPDPLLPNSGAWRHGFFDDGQVDDVEYLERVLGDLEARGAVDGKNPVFLTGISNGGGMVLEGARRLAHRVSGIAALMPYDGEHPKAVPDLTNTKLERVLFVYTLNDPGMAYKYHETLAPLPAQWATAMGLPAAVIAAPRKTPLPDVFVEGEGYQGKNAVALATRNSHVTQLDMVGPDGTGQVRVLVMDHAGHFWPSQTQFAEDWVLNRYGFCNQDFDAADTVWDFLRTAKQ